MYKPALLSGSFFAMLAVITGAFGAHYLKTMFSAEILGSFETGVRYQFYHALALLLTGILSLHLQSALLRRAAQLFIAGIVLFSGSIYLLCFLKSNQVIGLQGIGILTPLGGLCFIAGWLMLLLAVWKQQETR